MRLWKQDIRWRKDPHAMTTAQTDQNSARTQHMPDAETHRRTTGQRVWNARLLYLLLLVILVYRLHLLLPVLLDYQLHLLHLLLPVLLDYLLHLLLLVVLFLQLELMFLLFLYY